MKKVLFTLTLLFFVSLFLKSQGLPYGGPLGNQVGRDQPPVHYLLIKNFFNEEAPFKVQLLKVGTTKGFDSSYVLYVSIRGSSSYGIQQWNPYFCCSLGSVVEEPVIVAIAGVFFLYYRNNIFGKKENWIKIQFLEISEKIPISSSVFLFL